MLSLKKMQYRHKLTAVILLFTMLPMVILSMFLINKIWDGKVDGIISRNKAQLENSASMVDTLLYSCTEKLLYINSNYYILSFLETNIDLNLVGDISFDEYLKSVLGAMSAGNSGMDVVIYTMNSINYDSGRLKGIDKFQNETGSGNGAGTRARNETGIGAETETGIGAETETGTSLKDEILEYGGSKLLWKFRNLKKFQGADGEATGCLCLYKRVVVANKPLAIIEIRIPLSRISDIFRYELPEGSYIALGDPNDTRNRIIMSRKQDFHPADEMAGPDANSIPAADCYVLNRELKSGMDSVCMYIPGNYVRQELKLYWMAMAAVFMLVAVFIVIAVELASFSLTKKLQLLLTDMNTNVEKLIDDDRLQTYQAEDEFGAIGKRFYELIQRIKDYYRRINEYEFERKILETELLQERINPHFLYNTLSTMRWICSDGKVLNAIDSLVKYYRIALNKGSSIVSILQELEMIEEYLRLQKFAYGYVFDYRIDVGEDIGDNKILKHMLQPIVENAVLHGINERESGGMITIGCRKDNEKIVFEVSDNGNGMEQARIDDLLNDRAERLYSGYGIRNVQKRMELFYAGDYSLQIKTAPGQGTTVVLTIPGYLNSDIQDRMK